MMMNFFKSVKGFKARQDGSTTVEFVILFPALMSLFLMGLESGFYMVRSVMLERSVDLSIREVRMSETALPSFKSLKKSICENALILPDCENSIQIEMFPVATNSGAIAALNNATPCVDKGATDPYENVNYNVGGENEMMLVRVCALAEPLFPTTAFGASMVRDNYGNHAIVATSAFVTEPGARAEEVIQAANGAGN